MLPKYNKQPSPAHRPTNIICTNIQPPPHTNSPNKPPPPPQKPLTMSTTDTMDVAANAVSLRPPAIDDSTTIISSCHPVSNPETPAICCQCALKTLAVPLRASTRVSSHCFCSLLRLWWTSILTPLPRVAPSACGCVKEEGRCGRGRCDGGWVGVDGFCHPIHKHSIIIPCTSTQHIYTTDTDGHYTCDPLTTHSHIHTPPLLCCWWLPCDVQYTQVGAAYPTPLAPTQQG